MTKLGVAFWVGLVVATGFTTFKVKYAVQDIEEELHRVRKHTVAEQQETRVLAAEWTYLTQPERLAELNRRFVQLTPLAAKQLHPRIEDMPLRTPTAPADIVVAANTAQPVAAAPASATAPAAAAPAARPVAAAVPTAAAPTASRALAVAAATFIAPAHAAAAPHPVQLAKATPGSLDALIAQIATAR